MHKIFLLLVFLFICGCTYKKIEIQKSEYKKLPPINFNEIKPVHEFNCWELREYSFSGDSILFSSGNCSSSRNLIFRNIITGFGKRCLPGICFKYIVTYDKNDTLICNNTNSLKKFLGNIDNISEAQLLTTGYNYFPDSSSIYKCDKTGYWIILKKLVKTGQPIQVDRFLLKVTKNGKIKILGREISSKIDNAMI